MGRNLLTGLMSAGLIAFFILPSFALRIDYQLGSNFDDVQIGVIEEAIGEWAELLGGADGFATEIVFYCDSDLGSSCGALGITKDWIIGEDGYPVSSAVVVDGDALTWTSGSPVARGYDARYLLQHEIAHALGWSSGIPAFGEGIVNDGLGRYYNLSDRGEAARYDPDAFDYALEADPFMGTHSPDGNDLMYYAIERGVRRGPSRHHAMILADAYGYCYVPEPATIAMALCLGGTALIFRRRRSA